MRIDSQKGGIIAGLLAVLWLALFFVIMLGVFAYKAEYLRFEWGLKEEKAEPIYDKNTIDVLKKKEEELAVKSEAVKQERLAAERIINQIAIEKQQIAKEREEIGENLREIEGFFQKFSSEEEDELKKLSKLYESMKASEATAIFKEIDVETIAELLKRVKSRNSAKILAAMGEEDADWAAEVSNIMQGKNKKEAFSRAGK